MVDSGVPWYIAQILLPFLLFKVYPTMTSLYFKSHIIKLPKLEKNSSGSYRPWVLVSSVALNRCELLVKPLVFPEAGVPHL